jgi:hypothetical protein
MALVLIRPVAEFAQAVEEHGPRQGVAGVTRPRLHRWSAEKL